jgi:HK97 family phage portal protein
MGFHGIRADIGGAPAPWDDYWYEQVGAPSVSGMRVSASTVKRLSTVIAAVTARGRALGTMPCFIYTDIAGGGKKMVKKHPMFKVLHERPNDLQTAYEFYQMQNAHVDLRGNSYCEIETSSRGVIGQLWPMHPDRVRVEQLSSGRLRYIYDDPLTNNTRVLLQDEVFHVRDWADTTAVGQSRITMGTDVFGVALAQQDYSGKYLKNDGAAGAFMTGLNFKSKADEDEYVKQFQNSGTGDKRHRVRMLPPGVDIKTLGVKPIDMQLLESKKSSAVEICTMLNILPHLIGVDTGKSATYASVEQFNLMHAQQCVLPIAVMWEQAIQRDLIDDDRFYAKFSLAALLRGDYATRTAGYAVAVEHGWLSPDDVRELEDMNPIAGGIGKQYFRPLNWTTLDAPIQPIKTAGADPSVADDDEDTDEIGEGGDNGTGSDPGQQGRMVASLEIMAHDAAARCVRREVGSVRKLIDQERTSKHAAAFYEEHHRFIVGALHLRALPGLKAKQACDERKSQLTMYLEEERYAEARVWIERVAATETPKLAALAVEGVL